MKNLILASIGFVVLYNIILFQTGGGIGNGLFFLLLNAFYFAFKRQECKNLTLAVISSVLSVTFGLLIGLRSNEIIQTVNFFTAIFFSLTALYFYKSDQDFSFRIPHFLLTPLIVITGSITSSFSFFTLRPIASDKSNKNASASLIRGIVITLPIIAILLILLTKADPVFNKIVENIFSDIWQRAIISTLLFVGLISFGVTKVKEFFNIATPTPQKDISHKVYELLILVGSISLLFAGFMAVEFTYFFSNIGERELQQLGIASLTYSEYVRKGFFELLAASTVAALVMIYVMRYIHGFDKLEKLWIQILSATLTVEIGLLVLSAMQRLNLYSQAHGLTRARVFGFLFLLWLVAMLVIFLGRVFKQVKPQLLFSLTIIFSIIFLFAINITNIDGLISSKYQPSVNGEVDYYYLVNLSPDSATSWEDAVVDVQKVLNDLAQVKTFSTEDYRKFYWSKSTLERLDSEIGYLTAKYGTVDEFLERHKYDDEKQKQDNTKKWNELRKWPSFNLAEKDAYNFVADKKDTFKQVSALLEKAKYFEITRVPDELRNTVPLDRPTQPPLL